MSYDFRSLLKNNGPVAINVREYLKPVGGYDVPICPPTYALTMSESVKHPYNINSTGNNNNQCLIDNIGSQSNRIEPSFNDFDPRIVPLIEIQGAKKPINLLTVSHRLADAYVRATKEREQVQKIFEAYEQKNPLPLAEIAPTTILFGAWDSRSSHTRIPRIVESVIWATNVVPQTYTAQYEPPLRYKDMVEEGLLPDGLKKPSEAGFDSVPVTNTQSGFRTPGGVVVNGDIFRNAVLSMVTIRNLHGGDKTPALQEYMLGLSLMATLYEQDFHLRQRCQLVLDPERAKERNRKSPVVAVYRDGRQETLDISYSDVKAFAKDAASRFKVSQERKTFTYDEKTAKTFFAKGAKTPKTGETNGNDADE